MTWKGFFEGIQAFFENVAFTPYNALRSLEPENWWGANIVTWVFILITFVALIYWMKEIKKYDDAGDEDKSIVSHEYLG
jgi:hypothetical protein